LERPHVNRRGVAIGDALNAGYGYLRSEGRSYW
jgi:hypothetical protein